MSKYKAIDLFAGIGGIRLAFQMAFKDDIEFVFSSEIYDKAIKVYEANFGETPYGDITKIDPKQIPDHDILLAGWPCQSFSVAGRMEGLKDPRGNLFYTIANILKEKRPYAFLLENVWYLERHDKGRTFKTIMRILEYDLKYYVYHDILNAKYYGVPQNRPRIFIVGFKEPIRFKFPPPSPDIPPLKSILQKNVPAKYYISEKYLNGLKNHRKRHEAKGHGFGFRILDPEGVANALVIGGMGRERNLVIDKPAPTSYEPGSRKVGKPNSEGIRKLTPEECKRLMGFPSWFKIPIADTYAYRVLAESVVVPLVEKIARQMKESLKKRELIGLHKWS